MLVWPGLEGAMGSIASLETINMPRSQSMLLHSKKSSISEKPSFDYPPLANN
jgi:hypothetical protein